jgi:hypothetical protein
MSPGVRRYIQFGAASVGARIVLGIGFPVLARMTYRDEGIGEALAASVRYLEPLWQAFELLPFLLLGAVCASLGQRAPTHAIGLFAAGLLAYSAIYYFGYMRVEAYMQQHAWTAASLAAGFIPAKCLGVVFLAFLIRLILARPNVPAKA